MRIIIVIKKHYLLSQIVCGFIYAIIIGERSDETWDNKLVFN